MHRTARWSTSLLALTLLASCGEPPRRTPVGGAQPTAPSAAPVEGAPVQGEPVDLRGEIHVVGDLALDVPDGAVVFVSLKAREGPPMPLLARKAELDGAQRREDGALIVPFALTGTDTMGMGGEVTSAQLTDSYDLEVIFDPTGGLTDASAQTRARIPVDGHDLDGLVIEVGG